MAIKIVTDSTADLPPEVAREWDICVVPLNVHFGEKTYKDGVTISADEFYQKLAVADKLPTTSQPSVGEFLDVYRNLLDQGHQVLSVHISAKLSGTLNSAYQARDALLGKGRIEIVDSLQASMSLGLIVLEAARVVKDGATMDEALERVQRAVAEIREFFMVDTLEYLEKGGRIGRAQAFLGGLLRIKPILAVKDGEVHPVDRQRTRERGIQRLIELAEACAPVKEVAVGHTTTPQDAEKLRQRLQHLTPNKNILLCRAGPVIGAHAGPGTLAVALRVGP